MDMKPIFQCCLCKGRFADIHSLEAHIAITHVFYMPYECEICKNALFPTDQSLREHYQKIHKQKTYNIKYKVSPELEVRKEQLRQLMVQSSSKEIDLGLYGQQAQFLHSCIATQLLHTNLKKSAEILKANCEDDIKMDNNDDDDVSERSQNHEVFNFISEMAEGPSDAAFSNMNSEMPLDFDNFAESTNIRESHPELATSLSFDSNSNKRKRGRHKINQQEDEETERAEEVECIDCKRKVGKYRNSMLIHTSTHHCDQPIFECLGCNKKWYSLSARYKEHIKSKHSDDISLLKDNRNALLPLLKAKTANLFPGFYSYSSATFDG